MGIRYLDSLDDIEARHLKGFFVGWPSPPSQERHLKILKGSFAVELAWDADANRVVGFINAISDGEICAFVPLLEVLPVWQGNGIGRELTRRMLERLKDFYAVDVICDENVVGFYEKFGLIRGNAMMRRNYGALGE